MTTELKTTIPTPYEQKSVGMLNAFGDREIEITIRPPGAPKHIGASISYVFDGKEAGESNVDFGERFIKEYWLSCLRMIEKIKADSATKAARAAITINPENVPGGSIE